MLTRNRNCCLFSTHFGKNTGLEIRGPALAALMICCALLIGQTCSRNLKWVAFSFVNPDNYIGNCALLDCGLLSGFIGSTVANLILANSTWPKFVFFCLGDKTKNKQTTQKKTQKMRSIKKHLRNKPKIKKKKKTNKKNTKHTTTEKQETWDKNVVRFHKTRLMPVLV